MSESTVKCQRIEVGGIVQGVGVRPFVYRTACSLGLKGWVENTVHGVRIEVRGESAALDRFSGIMRNGAPPMARVLSVRRKLVKAPAYKKFEIRPSVSSQGRSTLICPDASICDDCLSELRDPGDRRYRYPFINCTNCGPRYTIILDLPYDRARTTMASFTMCPDCMAEFENPLDRRFHAQPNACPVCGPQVKLVDAGGRELSGPRAGPIEAAARWLLDGRVLAVKGLGGFHLAVDAANEQAARRLRDRKQRQ
ncbi:MAG: acylphosphatase, partial [Gemmatimonadota bacterium]|nr:acylphosphatase [Gemmatimonadota bacterium]